MAVQAENILHVLSGAGFAIQQQRMGRRSSITNEGSMVSLTVFESAAAQQIDGD